MAPRLVVETGQWKACLDTPRGERQSARQLKGEMGMNDLVKRLRDWANNSVGCNPANAPCGEAADEIERLRVALLEIIDEDNGPFADIARAALAGTSK